MGSGGDAAQNDGFGKDFCVLLYRGLCWTKPPLLPGDAGGVLYLCSSQPVGVFFVWFVVFFFKFF